MYYQILITCVPMPRCALPPNNCAISTSTLHSHNSAMLCVSKIVFEISPQNSPVFPQKSPVFPQNSPVFPQKSPVFLTYLHLCITFLQCCVCQRLCSKSCRKRALYFLKRALYFLKRALYFLKRALYFLKRALYFLKRALYFLKRALYFLKRHTNEYGMRVSCRKSSTFLNPYISAKEPCISSKEPCISSKDIRMSMVWKYHVKRALHFSTPTFPQKSSIFLRITYEWAATWVKDSMRVIASVVFRRPHFPRLKVHGGDMGWLQSVGSINYRSVLQNIVSFIGLFCKRDLWFNRDPTNRSHPVGDSMGAPCLLLYWVMPQTLIMLESVLSHVSIESCLNWVMSP